MENEVVDAPIRKKRRLIFRIFGSIFGKTYRNVSVAKELTLFQLLRAWYIRVKWLLFGVVVGYILYRVDIFINIEEWFKSLYHGMYG